MLKNIFEMILNFYSPKFFLKTSLFISIIIFLYILMVFQYFYFFLGLVNISTLPLGVFSRLTDCLFQKSPSSKNSLFFAFFNFLIFFSSTLLLLLVSYAILIAPLPSLLVLRPQGGATTMRRVLNEDMVMNGEHRTV